MFRGAALHPLRAQPCTLGGCNLAPWEGAALHPVTGWGSDAVHRRPRECSFLANGEDANGEQFGEAAPHAGAIEPCPIGDRPRSQVHRAIGEVSVSDCIVQHDEGRGPNSGEQAAFHDRPLPRVELQPWRVLALLLLRLGASLAHRRAPCGA